MRATWMVISAALLLSAPPPAVSATMLQPQASDPLAWEIGPVYGRRNFSVGMPPHPSPGRRGWYFDFPYPDVRAGHVHALTFNHGPLTGKRRIELRYRIDAARGVRFVPQEHPELPGIVSLYFQRRGDPGTGRGRYETYRFWSPHHAVLDLSPGEHVLSVSLSDEWISVNGRPVSATPYEYREALANAQRVGFVLGSRLARGHGVYTTGPARLTVISFRVI